MTRERRDPGTTALPAKSLYQPETAPSAGLPTLIDMDTLAQSLGVSIRHLRRLVDERRIPFVKVGRYVRFDVTDVAAWVDDHRVPVFRCEPVVTTARYHEG